MANPDHPNGTEHLSLFLEQIDAGGWAEARETVRGMTGRRRALCGRLLAAAGAGVHVADNDFETAELYLEGLRADGTLDENGWLHVLWAMDQEETGAALRRRLMTMERLAPADDVEDAGQAADAPTDDGPKDEKHLRALMEAEALAHAAEDMDAMDLGEIVLLTRREIVGLIRLPAFKAAWAAVKAKREAKRREDAFTFTAFSDPLVSRNGWHKRADDEDGEDGPAAPADAAIPVPPAPEPEPEPEPEAPAACPEDEDDGVAPMPAAEIDPRIGWLDDLTYLDETFIRYGRETFVGMPAGPERAALRLHLLAVRRFVPALEAARAAREYDGMEPLLTELETAGTLAPRLLRAMRDEAARIMRLFPADVAANGHAG